MAALVNGDGSPLHGKIGELERVVQEQTNEIASLKQAYADVVRRLSALEAGTGQRAKTAFSAPAPKSAGEPKKSAAKRPEAAVSKSAAQPTSTEPKAPPKDKDPPQRKTPKAPAVRQSLPASAGRGRSTPSSRSAKATSPSHGRGHGKETLSVHEADGYVKLTLRGRSQKLFAPEQLVASLTDASRLSAPDTQLRLEWVYGYRGRDSRNNLFALPTAEVIYFVAGVVVMHNVNDNTQRHYAGHTDDVKCIAIHPDKVTIATGQVAGHDAAEGKPHVRIWNSVNLNTIHVLGLGFFERAVCCVSFSKADGGQLMAAVDDSNEHTLSIWEWQAGDKGRKIVDNKSSGDPVFACEFHPTDNKQLVTCGKGHIIFWVFDGSALTKHSGIFEGCERPKFVLSLLFTDNGDCVTGDSSGAVLCWDSVKHKVKKVVPAVHDDKGTLALCQLKNGQLLSGGGDGRLRQLDATSFEPTGVTVQLNVDAYGGVRTIVQLADDEVLIGTRHNQLVKTQLLANAAATSVLHGHHDELWGLACHPCEQQFITACYDKTLCCWDPLQKGLLWSLDLPDAGHCACYHPNGSLVAVGLRTHAFVVINVHTREIVLHEDQGSEQIEAIAYSPDGNYLALGSRDNFVYIYGVQLDGTQYKLIGKCSGHSSFITHVDWSADSEHLQTNSGDYELLYWRMPDCTQVASGSTQLRDTQWATSSCTIQFGTCGIWPAGADGTDVNACARSNNGDLVASGDDFGKVNLYRYPCYLAKTPAHSYGGHSSHVTNVRFLVNDGRLLSTGGKDCAIFQWQLA